MFPMTSLMALCVLVALLGVVAIVLGLIPATSRYVAGGVGAGIALLVVGVVLAAVLHLTGAAVW
jgi:uncharacterized membrane protein